MNWKSQDPTIHKISEGFFDEPFWPVFDKTLLRSELLCDPFQLGIRMMSAWAMCLDVASLHGFFGEVLMEGAFFIGVRATTTTNTTCLQCESLNLEATHLLEHVLESFLHILGIPLPLEHVALTIT